MVSVTNDRSRHSLEKYITLVVVYGLAILPSILMLAWLLWGLEDKFSGFALSFDCEDLACTIAWRTFNWHPFLMTFAFVTLFTQAITAFKLLPFNHTICKYIHFGAQTTGLICALLGFMIVVIFKQKTGNYNFYTAHSYLGLISVLFFLIQYGVGFISFLFPKLPDGPRGTVHSFHVFAGFCIYVLTTCTIYTGVADRQLICGWGGCGMSTSVYSYNWIGVNAVILFSVAACVSVFWAHKPPTKRALYEKVKVDDYTALQ